MGKKSKPVLPVRLTGTRSEKMYRRPFPPMVVLFFIFVNLSGSAVSAVRIWIWRLEATFNIQIEGGTFLFGPSTELGLRAGGLVLMALGALALAWRFYRRTHKAKTKIGWLLFWSGLILFLACWQPVFNPLGLVLWYEGFLAYGETVHYLWIESLLLWVAIAAVGYIGFYALQKRYKALTATQSQGSARFGDTRHLETSGRLYLGMLGENRYFDSGMFHRMTIAPTRSGKGTARIIPALLSWPGSVFVMDPKGENFAVTARYRAQSLGQTVFVLDPCRIVRSFPLKRDVGIFDLIRPEDQSAFDDIGLSSTDSERTGNWQKADAVSVQKYIDETKQALEHFYNNAAFVNWQKALASVSHAGSTSHVESVSHVGASGADDVLARTQVRLTEAMIDFGPRTAIGYHEACLQVGIDAMPLQELQMWQHALKKMLADHQTGNIFFARNNPMDDVRRDLAFVYDDALYLATVLLPENQTGGSGKDDFWNKLAVQISAALIAYVGLYHEGKARSLYAFRKYVMMGAREQVKFMSEAAEDDQVLPMIRNAFSAFLNTSPNTRTSIMATVRSATDFLESLPIRSVMSGSDFHGSMLKHRKVTVYVVIPFDKMQAYKGWLRLMVGLTQNAMLQTVVSGENQVLMLLDEFANLGYMPMIEEGASYVQGHGITYWIFLQSLAQLTKTYRKSDSLIGNTTFLEAFGINDVETAEYISKRLGVTTIFATTEGAGESGSARGMGRAQHSSSASSGVREQKRPLMTPDEVMNLKKGWRLEIEKFKKPLLLQLEDYFLSQAFLGKADPNPYHLSPALQQYVQQQNRLHQIKDANVYRALVEAEMSEDSPSSSMDEPQRAAPEADLQGTIEGGDQEPDVLDLGAESFGETNSAIALEQTTEGPEWG